MKDIIKCYVVTEAENVIVHRTAYGVVIKEKLKLTLNQYIKINTGWWVTICKASSLSDIGYNKYFATKAFANSYFNKMVKKYDLTCEKP